MHFNLQKRAAAFCSVKPAESRLERTRVIFYVGGGRVDGPSYIRECNLLLAFLYGPASSLKSCCWSLCECLQKYTQASFQLTRTQLGKSFAKSNFQLPTME